MSESAEPVPNPRHTSETDAWFTPASIVEATRSTLEAIDLDPASCPAANRVVRASRFFDEIDNGYLTPWAGRVFLNPPGGRCDEWGRRTEKVGRSASKAWWFRLANEFVAGRVPAAVFLGYSVEVLQTTQVDPERGEDGKELPIPLDFPLCFPSRRLSFTDEAGEVVKGNTHASVVVLLCDPDPRKGNLVRKRFREAFGLIGRVRMTGERA
jgi:hypothetical protein